MSLYKIAEIQLKKEGMEKEAVFSLIRKAWKVPEAIGEHYARKGSVLGTDVMQLFKRRVLKPPKRILKPKTPGLNKKLTRGEYLMLQELKKLGY